MIPAQHGAWAFIGLPAVLGLLAAPWTPLLIVAAVAWVVGFPVSYFGIAALRYPHPARFRRPLIVWCAIGVPLAAVLVVERPWLLWIGLGYVVAFVINVIFARRRDERALANDVIFIVECVAIVPVTWGIGAMPSGLLLAGFAETPTSVWVLTCACALALVGSTLHVKSLIRERGNPRFRVGSKLWALASLLASAPLAFAVGLPAGGLLVVPFAFFAVRAYAVPRLGLSPARIGVIETIGFVLVAAAGGIVGG